MPFTRRDLLALCGALWAAPLRPSLAAPAAHRFLNLRDVEFVTITARIILPGLGYRFVLSPGDRFGLGWYHDQGSQLAVLLIRRAGDSLLHIFTDGRTQREQIGDPAAADGILDRLVHNAHRIEMRGDSMRKNRPKSNA
jgi:IstB-like ATP binding protein